MRPPSGGPLCISFQCVRFVPLQQAVSRPIFDWQAMGRPSTQLIPSSERCLLVSIHFMVVTYQENGVTQYARLSHRSHMLAPVTVPT